MDEKELKAKLDEVYNIGFKNGRIEMKNKILKSINRDWNLFPPSQVNLLIKVLKKINRLR